MSDRSMRLLQPKLRVLYLISKTRKVKYNMSEISRLLGYSGDSHVNIMVHELLNDGFVRTKEIRRTNYLVLTRKGRRKIAPFAVTRSLPLLMAVVAFLPIFWAIDEVILRTLLTPFVLLLAGLLLLLIALFLSYETNILEKDYF